MALFALLCGEAGEIGYSVGRSVGWDLEEGRSGGWVVRVIAMITTLLSVMGNRLRKNRTDNSNNDAIVLTPQSSQQLLVRPSSCSICHHAISKMVYILSV